MNDTQLETVGQIRGFLAGTETIEFSMESTPERYARTQDKLIRLRYVTLSKRNKGVLRRYLQTVAKYSRQQLTRLIGQYKPTGKLGCRRQPRYRFTTHCTPQNIMLLLQTDELRSTLSVLATKKIFELESILLDNPGCKHCYPAPHDQPPYNISLRSNVVQWSTKKTRSYNHWRKPHILVTYAPPSRYWHL